MNIYTLAICATLLISCNNKSNTTEQSTKEEEIIKHFSKDSLLQSIMYSNIDTIKGHWRLTISKEDAIKRGVSEDIYNLFQKSICEVNSQIDSIKKKNPNAIIGYNLPVLTQAPL